MAFSNLYYTILNKPFFIDLRRIDAQAVIIDRLLRHETAGWEGGRLSERKPIERVYLWEQPEVEARGRVVTTDFNKAPEGSVAVVTLNGDMIKEGTYCSYGTEEIANVLREAADSLKICGIRLDIDSGGGAVDAIAPMLSAIAYSQSKGKPVVACCDLCASAAYYVACHCDRVVACNDISSEFGSIGVMMSFPDYAKYYEDHGIKIHTIYSNLSDYKNAPFEAARKGDYAAIKTEQLDPLALKFQEAVKSRRAALKTDVAGILNGRMFFARDALQNGLIDEVGSVESATRAVWQISQTL